MKKLICAVAILCIHHGSKAQENNPQNKPGTTIINSNSNNSVSGVNPNGNPGTILSNTTMSNSTNNTLIKPNTTIGNNVVFVPGTSTVTTRETIPVNNNAPNTVIITPATDPNAPITKTVTVPVENTPTTIIVNPQAGVVNANTNAPGKSSSTYPVLINYIPEQVVVKLKDTYGNKLYDITMLKKSDNKLLYIVRTVENGSFITHYLDEGGNVIKQ